MSFQRDFEHITYRSRTSEVRTDWSTERSTNLEVAYAIPLYQYETLYYHWCRTKLDKGAQLLNITMWENQERLT